MSDVDRQAATAHATGGARHRARELALQVLFALDVRESKSAEPPDAEVLFDEVAAHFEVPAAAVSFARELVRGVASRRPEIDECLAAAARNWRIDRMGRVDRNVLRLAIHELASTDTPVPVILDEAVRMAQRFGDEPSPAFVNGVLDAIARTLRPGAPGGARAAGTGGR